MRSETYDFIVIGGGSAGCIIAGELSANPDFQVLLLECGDAAEENPETLRADGYKDAFLNDRVIWERFSTPQAECGKKTLFMGSGRGMGGSGAVNAMVYTRGDKADYDQWQLPEWGWNDVVPTFEALEDRLKLLRREPTTFSEICIDAAEAAGFKRKEDLNDGRLKGHLGYEWMNAQGETRRSSYVAFLHPHRDRPNLTIETNAKAAQIEFDGERKASGVLYQDAKGALQRVGVKREVVLTAGALESPKLLMLSGIGPAAHLRQHGIDVLHDAPQIGQNFHDHPNVTLFFKGQREVDFHYPQLYGFHRANPHTPLPSHMADTCFVFYPARSSLREATMRMLPAMVLPPKLYFKDPLKKGFRRLIQFGLDRDFTKRMIRHTYGIVVILGKPQSRGEIKLASKRLEDQALINPAYFDHPDDLLTMVMGVRHARRIANTAPLQAWGNKEMIPKVSDEHDDIAHWVQHNAMTTYHYAGTCHMGSSQGAVVNTQLQLQGVQGVRVCDASVIPNVPVSAMNAPSMMIGLRASQLLLEAHT